MSDTKKNDRLNIRISTELKQEFAAYCKGIRYDMSEKIIELIIEEMKTNLKEIKL